MVSNHKCAKGNLEFLKSFYTVSVNHIDRILGRKDLKTITGECFLCIMYHLGKLTLVYLRNVAGVFQHWSVRSQRYWWYRRGNLCLTYHLRNRRNKNEQVIYLCIMPTESMYYHRIRTHMVGGFFLSLLHIFQWVFKYWFSINLYKSGSKGKKCQWALNIEFKIVHTYSWMPSS